MFLILIEMYECNMWVVYNVVESVDEVFSGV